MQKKKRLWKPYIKIQHALKRNSMQRKFSLAKIKPKTSTVFPSNRRTIFNTTEVPTF